MPELKIPYSPWQVKATQEIIFRPALVVELQKPFAQTPILSIVDSGADYCIFPSLVGTLLGIDVAKGKQRHVTGVGGGNETAYFHEVNLSIPGGPSYGCDVGFSHGLDFMKCGVLGQEGFFDRFEILFNRKRRFFTLRW